MLDRYPLVAALTQTLKSRSFWKSVISGGITALVDLALLFTLRETLHQSYWISVNAAFAFAILVNFSLQKFWTFSNRDLRGAHTQFMKFFFVAMGNIVMNNILMFILSAMLGIWYLGAQILATGMLAVVNFTLYRHFVFTEKLSGRVPSFSDSARIQP